MFLNDDIIVQQVAVGNALHVVLSACYK